MKLRIKRAKALLVKNRPCMVVELNKYDFDRALAYNDKDLDGYVIEIAKAKRSSDQNRYMWELITQVADASGVRPNDVYKQAIREAGSWLMVKVKNKDYEPLCRTWALNGIGWWVETERVGKEETLGRAYRGSSSYNTVEMSKLIDWVIEECHWYNIETETPEQIARRKAEWNEAEV